MDPGLLIAQAEHGGVLPLVALVVVGIAIVGGLAYRRRKGSDRDPGSDGDPGSDRGPEA